MADSSQPLPTRPADPSTTSDKDPNEPSKSALKKEAAKKAKAEKKAAAKAADAAAKPAQPTADAAPDTSTNDYGDLSQHGTSERPHVTTTLAEIASHEPSTESTVTFRAVVENAREQGAKMVFFVLGRRLDTIQALVVASESISRQMVKWSKGIPPQSTVIVTGLVQKPKENVKSASIGHLEIHIQRLFVESRAETPLPIQVDDSERPLPEESALQPAESRALRQGEIAKLLGLADPAVEQTERAPQRRGGLLQVDAGDGVGLRRLVCGRRRGHGRPSV